MEHVSHLHDVLNRVQGFIYPNEVELQWSLLIVLYPFITGLVAGAFILASLERVFNVKEVQPTYRLSLLTALAFLLVAPLPLLAHLGHPFRSFEIFLTPHLQSAMAMFGFVYAWYLMAVLLLELYFDYRVDLIKLSKKETGLRRLIYKVFTLGSTNTSERSAILDDRIGKAITIIGIPSAFLLHGYVGFIFGSVKANPWWSTPLMPVIFLFSAMVSGIALVMLIYMVMNWFKRTPLDMVCLDTIARYLLYILIIDFSLEMLDLIHRIYESEESFDILTLLMTSKLYISQLIIQVILGALIPMVLLGALQLGTVRETVRKWIYFGTGILTLTGILAMRWNVVIGGQLFSKSFRGFTIYKMSLFGQEGLLTFLILLLLPFLILGVFMWLFPLTKEEVETRKTITAAPEAA